ncbi:MAG: AMP-binding protein [Myxococcota bacterium]|nr:AMP-binding protein [Myxococcota bacterium]
MIAIPNPLAGAARSNPEGLAVRAQQGDIDYVDFRRRVALAAGVLGQKGLGPGSRVAVVGSPSLDWLVAFHAVGWLGGIVQPFSHKLTEAALLASLENAKPDWLLVSEAPPQQWAARASSIVLEGGEVEVAERDWPLDEVRLEIASSGTTGEPHMVPLSVAQLVFGAMGSALKLGHLPGDVWLCCLPLHHVGGLSIVLRCAWYGTTVKLSQRFEAEAVAADLEGGEVTHVSLVPTMLSDVLEVPFEVHPSLRVLLLGGASAPQSLLERCREKNLPVAVTWGMTETGSQVATRRPGDFSEGSDVGHPLAFARVIAGVDGLVVQGPVAPGGRYSTRDVGCLDESGRVLLEGRVDDVIVSGGENIHPSVVESVLEAHPGIVSAVVIGREDERWGQRPVAWLEASNPQDLPSAESLKQWCGEKLAGFEVPDAFRWADSLPRTELGKRLRSVVREMESALAENPLDH